VLELEVRKRPPSTLRNALMAGPLEVPELEVRKIETWMAAPLRMLPACPVVTTTEVEDIDGEPPGGAAGMSGRSYHRS
jgi:hypothetical protein